MPSTCVTPSRRVVLQSGLAGGLVLAFQWPLRAAPVDKTEQPPDHPDGQFAPNAFIRIDNSGKTTLMMPQAEMGQGVYTAIAMILAEELDADFARVVIEHGPPSDKLYGNPVFGIQVTGNSNSIGSTYTDTEIAAVANYVTGRFGSAASKLTAKDVADLRGQTAR